MRFFIDASVLYAMIASSRGGGRELARLAEIGVITLITSSYAFDEAIRAFEIKNPRGLAQLSQLRGLPFWLWHEHTREDVLIARTIVADPFDAPIIAAARTAKVDALVSFDRRHLHTKAVEAFVGAPTLTAGDALALIRGKAG